MKRVRVWEIGIGPHWKSVLRNFAPSAFLRDSGKGFTQKRRGPQSYAEMLA